MEIIVWGQGMVIHISSSAGVSVGIGKISSKSHCNQCKMRAFASGRGAQCPSAAGAGGTQGLRGTPRVPGGPPGSIAVMEEWLLCLQVCTAVSARGVQPFPCNGCPWNSAPLATITCTGM